MLGNYACPSYGDEAGFSVCRLPAVVNEALKINIKNQTRLCFLQIKRVWASESFIYHV